MARLVGKKKIYYEALVKVRQSISEQIKFHASEALDSDSGKKKMATHMADLGSDNSRREMELQLLTEEGDVLERIDEAIDRLHHNDYGSCIDCEKDISDARLEVKPYAYYCIKCKSIREKNNGMNPYVD
jgi:RNA polymerase-binding transcription factor